MYNYKLSSLSKRILNFHVFLFINKKKNIILIILLFIMVLMADLLSAISQALNIDYIHKRKILTIK